MGTVFALAAKDARILLFCEQSFPGSPEFAKYLADRIVHFNGSLEVARVMCETLLAQHGSPPPIVTAECVERLAVDHIKGAVGKINQANPLPPSKVVSNTMVFLCRLQGVIQESHQKSGFVLMPREGVSNLNDEDIARVYYCAQGMLAGLAVDPRAEPEKNTIQSTVDASHATKRRVRK